MANNRDGDSSDSDLDLLPPIRGGAGAAALGAGTGGGQATYGSGGGTMKTDVQNFGRVNPKSNMADADPLGVDVNVTFDNVGGLDGHINQLKEMVALPLLYPEVFQQFGITPPRGVLFHGPPGTGKTLLARALAASCSNGNTKIAFFMRKGADVLSKWVGEAERQLRMLFEEARAAQPSIIFFDEIDGLAPVRSSKQDQIHASLVSTLLALMDGMDGRGQVIVIGATNRPDAVDPALRRPGRFDREFYFPLPNKEARKKIISINTRKWTPQLSDQILDQLAGLTKGYGGADLRALCTEAALNAVQRRYPQIYSSEDRLLLDPSSITVGAKDFMMSVKKIVPSSARSSSSAALQLPVHLVPILQSPLERLKVAVDKILPRNKAKSALEEAQYEDEVGDDLEKHAMIHSLDKMRTYRPRVLLQGPAGMGQGYLGPAILHHLEGFHVQSLDLGSLLGDSTRTSEAAIVQLFVEAKRHQPSVLFIPSLLPWSLALTETARTTFRALLDSVPSSDPVLLLAILDGPFSDLPKDVRKWFGIGKEGRVELDIPSADERTEYFTSLVETYSKPPTAFPDALPRRKRVLEILPLAPPLPPRPPTQAEIERDLEEDEKARHMMLLSFSPLWPDVEKKYGRFATAAKTGAQTLYQEWMDAIEAAKEAAANAGTTVDSAASESALLLNGHGDANGHTQPLVPAVSLPVIVSHPELPLEISTSSLPVTFAPAPTPLDNLFGADSPVAPPVAIPEIVEQDVIIAAPRSAPEIPAEPSWKPHDIDLSRIGQRVLRYKYFAPQDFIDDILKIVQNAKNIDDPSILLKTEELLAQIKAHVDAFDPQWMPRFDRYRKRMLDRKAEAVKRREAVEAAKGTEAGEPSSAKNPEEAPDTAVSEKVGDVANGLKRTREEEEVNDERDGKRARDETMDVDARDNHLSVLPDSLANGTPIPSQISMAGTEASFVTTATTIPSVPASRPPSPPAPVYPPFICPEGDIAKLGAELRVMTGDLNVDQLEQLRAGLYDLIWRSRSEWDRREILAKAVQKVRELVNEVRELEED